MILQGIEKEVSHKWFARGQSDFLLGKTGDAWKLLSLDEDHDRQMQIDAWMAGWRTARRQKSQST